MPQLMQTPTIVTTSWDDGHPSDLKVAELLRSRGMGGTFYVPVSHNRRPILDRAGLRSLTLEGFEVGGHGFSHRILLGLSREEIDLEVRACKQFLEDILGKDVRMFCYPRGRYDTNVLRHVKEAGYEGGRTTRMLAFRIGFRPFEMPTTLQAYPHVKRTYFKNFARYRDIRGLYEYSARFSRLDSWTDLGKRLFDHVLQEGGIWHLYGHSWEIDELGLWDDLEKILDYVCRRGGVRYLSNVDVLRVEPEKKDALLENESVPTR